MLKYHFIIAKSKVEYFITFKVQWYSDKGDKS